MKSLVPFLAAAAAALLAFPQSGEYKPKKETIPGPPVAQPIAFSHKTHAQAGLPCNACHTMPGEGFQATVPTETFCMGCHTKVKTDSPEIRKLAKFAEEKQPVPWARIYRVPDMVWFSHVLHVKDAELACSECHGDVAARDVLFQEKSVSMSTCMDCHARMQAANGCDTCHPSQ